MARILLAEALPVTREGLQRIIASTRGNVVAHVDSQRDLLREISNDGHDLLILDTSLPGSDWLETLKQVRSQRPRLPVLVLSALLDEDDAIRAFRAGASGYLTTDCSPDELSSAVDKILHGGRFVSDSVSGRIATALENGSLKPPDEVLSDRESQVMRLLVSGKTVSEIARDMSLSVKTVSTYRSRILEKLNLKNNVELARYYARRVDGGTVRCPECGHDNPRSARFCTECGSALETTVGSPGEAAHPSADRAGAPSRRPSLLPRSKWLVSALGVAVVAVAVIIWRLLAAPAPVELKYDDGTSEAEVHSDMGGYLIHFSPPSVPFVLEKVRVYGAALPSERTDFELQVWDAEQQIIYTASQPVAIFPEVNTVPDARNGSRWVDIAIPAVQVNGDFMVHLFAASTPLKGIVVGVDDSTWNLHSSLTNVTSSGGYEARDGWGSYLPTLWFADKSKVNWMIRVVGRPSTAKPPTGAPPAPASASSGSGYAPTEVHALPALDAFMKGFTFADWKPFSAAPPGLYLSPVADGALEELTATGTNWISLLVNVGQETIDSTTLFRTQPRTATDEELRRMVDLAHSQGMRVMLMPFVGLSNDTNHGVHQIGTAFSSEEQWQAWFASYGDLINHYAGFSQAAGVDMLSVGRLLGGTTHREQDWRRIVEDARQRFKGTITYSSGWGEYANIAWWDAVDYIDVEAFEPLTDKNDPTLEELKSAWVQKGYLTDIENLSERFNMPVILEFGYESKDGANRWPGTSYTMELPLDLQEQADCYRAALEVFWGRPWLKGIFWWQWLAGPYPGGPSNNGQTPYLKPAEEVLKEFYLEP